MDGTITGAGQGRVRSDPTVTMMQPKACNMRVRFLEPDEMARLEAMPPR